MKKAREIDGLDLFAPSTRGPQAPRVKVAAGRPVSCSFQYCAVNPAPQGAGTPF